MGCYGYVLKRPTLSGASEEKLASCRAIVTFNGSCHQTADVLVGNTLAANTLATNTLVANTLAVHFHLLVTEVGSRREQEVVFCSVPGDAAAETTALLVFFNKNVKKFGAKTENCVFFQIQRS